MQRRVAIIGAGVVGTAMGYILQRRGFQVTAVASRSLTSARRAARFIGRSPRPYADLAAAASSASIILITTPDSAIRNVCAVIAKGKGFRKGTLVLHASGFYSSRVLDAAKRRGALVGSIHPLQSFASPKIAVNLLPGSYFGWEGSRGSRTRILRIIRALGGTPLEIQASSKALYHAGAVLVSNYTVSLFASGVELLEKSRRGKRPIVGKFSSASALLPLLEGSVANLRQLGVPKGLTGPIARGDVSVVQGQIREIRKKARGLLALYLLLGRRTIPLGLEKKTLRPSSAAQLKKMLKPR